jgi:hypothetical protein
LTGKSREAKEAHISIPAREEKPKTKKKIIIFYAITPMQ